MLSGLKWKLNKEILPNIKLQLDWHKNQQQRKRMADNNWRAEKVQNGNRGVWCLGGSWKLRVSLASLNTHPISQIILKVQDCYKWILVPLPTEDNTWCHKSIPKFLCQKLPQLLSCYNPGRQASFIFVLPPVCSTFVDMSSKKKFPSNRFRKSNALFSFGVSLLAVYLNPSVLNCHLEILTGLESEMGKGQSAL